MKRTETYEKRVFFTWPNGVAIGTLSNCMGLNANENFNQQLDYELEISI